MTNALKAELAERLAAKKVLVVVGTGVSRAATSDDPLASWKGLITNGIGRCVELGVEGSDAEWQELQQRQLSRPYVSDLLGVAKQVERRLQSCGQGDWRQWLRETVGSQKAMGPAIIEAIQALGAPIATLNYDGLLERSAPLGRSYT